MSLHLSTRYSHSSTRMLSMKAKDAPTPDLILMAAFGAAARYDVNVSGARALVWIDSKLRVHGPSNRPTLTRLAAELKMTLGGAHRVLAALENREPPLVQTERGPRGTRSVGIALTLDGEKVVKGLWETVDPSAASRVEVVRQSASRVPDVIQQLSWNEDSLDLELTPVSAVESDEVAEWMTEFLSKVPVKRKSPKGVILRFATIHDAVYFKLRWV